jgi:hypothetical protein
MSFDLAFAPRDQDRLDIREVLLQRGARPTPVSVAICDTPPLISAACKTPSPVLHAAAALLLLLTATVLAVYKPRGMTRYGWRKQQRCGARFRCRKRPL